MDTTFIAPEKKRGINNLLFQVISVDGNKLTYNCYTADGLLYDSFELKQIHITVQFFLQKQIKAQKL